MLIFDSGAELSVDLAEYYNWKIQQFLLTEFFDPLTEADDTDGELEIFFPDERLLRGNAEKCRQAVVDLLLWSRDRRLHSLSAIHLYALWNLLRKIWDDCNCDELKKNYFDDEDLGEQYMIQKTWEKVKLKYREQFKNITELKQYLHDVDNMINDCFEDIDFVTFSGMLCEEIAAEKDVPEGLLKDYEDLIPHELLEHYREIRAQQTGELFADLRRVLAEFEHGLNFGGYQKLLWYGDEFCDERRVHWLLKIVFDYGFRKDEAVIDHEVSTGVGDVDFRVMNRALEKVLVEVKLAKNPGLRSGFAKQLPQYMEAERCKRAYYLIFCHTEQEIARVRKMVENFPKIPGKEIVPWVFDATKKTVASKLR